MFCTDIKLEKLTFKVDYSLINIWSNLVLACISAVSLVCTATSMTVTLNTLDGFVGKMFAVKNPRGCFTKGTDKTETRLTFLYEDPETDCGVKK